MALAVADAAVKPSSLPPPPPPPTRIIVVRFVLAPMLGPIHVVARALRYLCLATAWVISAGSAAAIVARHACREGSAPLVFLEAFTDAGFKFSFCIIFIFLALAAVLLFGMCLVYLVAVVSRSGSKVKKSAFGAIRQGSTRGLSRLPCAVVLGLVADLPFILLIVAGLLVVMMTSSPAEGSISQGEMIGTMIAEVGIFGFHAISCFVIIPALALDVWRDDRSDTKLGLGVADC